MHDLLKGFSTMELALIYCVGFAALTVACIFLCRPYSRRWIHGRRNANDMIGFSLQSFAALYGILLGLLAVEAYQDFSSVKDAVSKKALTFATLRHNLDGLPAPVSGALQEDLRDYAVEALETHWPKDVTTPPPTGASPILRRMLGRLLAFQPATKSEELVYGEVFRQVNLLIEQRRLLLSSEGNGIPGAMWAVVYIGAFLFILLMCLFDMEAHVHVLLGATTALFLGAVVFLIAALDNPFRGGVTVDPAPIVEMRDALAHENPPAAAGQRREL
ncbi:DUF4239 domain-containing protein [Methylocystis sp. Sn-Cys]|uniref:bestrophin-like domain n=1 Tax=Methylocystis sp. Sn-Cys TaxID=1701263 RepID=UPI001FEDE7F7|nr:DUF4239 domain-containing protein [Methylocystis sp. Sn-Cys]